MIDLSLIINSFNTKDLTIEAVKSAIRNMNKMSFEIIVIENNSSDGSLGALIALAKKEKCVRLIVNRKNLGFAGGNNQGMKAAKGRYLLFLNSDTKTGSPIYTGLVRWMDDHPKVGISSCALKNPDGSVQATGGFFPTLIRVFSWMTIQDFPWVDSVIKPFHPLHSKSSFARGEDFYKKEHEQDWVTGAFFLIRSDLAKKLKGFDEQYFMYVEEVDLCFRVKQLGYKVWYLPQWSIVHYGGASDKTKGAALVAEYNGIKRFYKKFFPNWQYPLLRFCLKLGALGRIFLFGILEGWETAKIYGKLFISA